MIEEFDRHEGGVTDEALIGLVGTAFDEGRRGYETSDVLARGRRLRRRKRAVPAFAAFGALAACASLALASAAGTAGANTGHALTANGTVVNVDNAAFSVHTDTKTGKITVTIRQFSDEDELKRILAKAGVRTVFASETGGLGKVITSCTWPGATILNSHDEVLYSARTEGHHPDPGAPDVFVVDPARMPAGSVLAFDYVNAGKARPGLAIVMALLSGEPTGCR